MFKGEASLKGGSELVAQPLKLPEKVCSLPFHWFMWLPEGRSTLEHPGQRDPR